MAKIIPVDTGKQACKIILIILITVQQMDKKCDFPIEGIHRHVVKYIQSLPNLSGKIVLDIPCGNGRASCEFKRKGAKVIVLDLFPEFMEVLGIEAKYADLSKKLPIENESIDYIICQEGIEHIPNQLNVLQEFNRVLKKNGCALITTPSNSHTRARLSYFLFETDFYKRMPPTEIDGVWFANNKQADLYFGHLFLLSVQHLQTLLTISGFKTEQRIKTSIGSTSLILTLVLYPIFVLSSLLTYFSYRNKNQHIDKDTRFKILWDRVKLNLSPITLIYKDIFWVVKKTDNLDVVINQLKSVQKN
ncbi:class I SAM-dependent methyltransferase [Bathymodiolus heckerae thiotrophic gill symbiont]|uniref:class I SAM-dependent methyltransferase n=1 Tax=Bathymodiolus heckerae thiotrophic gill symbiont TaxID=1052212 RepID=UPI0010FEF14B|nr:class I SAM-dependent methyltransferase [Bathymodiolus heckerae thiotrophic gill symbiont]